MPHRDADGTLPEDVTRLPSSPAKSTSGWLSSSDAISHGRFAPGTTLTDRYRIVGLLGKGGMGEVYRADDLKLGQAVALKFLPPELSHDAGRLARFHAEVRLSRQISHPNVCRVYDIDEVDGFTFLSMEYVDGEELASLLRRIGRLPEDKGLEMARQLCAGIAAAHDRGVLHRDLKPANVMIDGRGSIRVLDFGLAVAAGTTDAVHAGTPAYMAPEQLAGREVSVQSDIYALGLILFEMFTGRRAITADKLADLLRVHENDTLTHPTEIVPSLDPAIERAILRCLERAPAKRPVSALAVAAALPGGDPLAAALAAGETPSPAMVAAAGREEALPAALAFGSVAGVALMLLALALVADRALLVNAIPPPKPVDVLVDRADAIRATLGYTDVPRDRYYEMEADGPYLNHVSTTDSSPGRWERLRRGRPAAVVFWQRTSPRDLVPLSMAGTPTLVDPPSTVSGMTTIITDTQGRLIGFKAVPPERTIGTEPAATPDWAALFTAADLPFASFTPVTPEWAPSSFADTRAAWEGPIPDEPATRVRVEAAAYRGRPVSFKIIWPWSRSASMEQAPRRTADVVGSVIVTATLVCLIAAAAWLARRHLRRGRGDRRGADRVALFNVALSAIGWVLAAHHFADFNQEAVSLLLFTALALLTAAIVWLFYLALEPLVRKWHPRALVGWTRLLAGAIRDPHVGQDVLVGVVVGTLIALIRAPLGILPPLTGHAPSVPVVTSFAPLIGLRHTLGDIALSIPNAIQSGMILLFAVVIARLLFRRTWAAVGAIFVIVLAVIVIELSEDPGRWTQLALIIPGLLVWLAVPVRFGLLASIVMFLTWSVLELLPLTVDPGARHFGASLWILAGVFGLSLLAAYAARAGQPVAWLSDD